MTLTEGIATIRDRFQGYDADGIAYAEYKLGTRGQKMRRICRITDVFVKSNEVLLQIAPSEEDDYRTHMTVQDLLERLIELPPDCGKYSLEACEPECVFPEEETSIRFDYPIVATARDDSLQLCLLVHVEPGLDQPRKQRWKFWQRT